MRTTTTSKEVILSVSREIALEQGIESITIKKIAQGCNISVGSVYRQFKSKSDLITATVESIWKDMLKISPESIVSSSFSDSLKCTFEVVRNCAEEHPEFLTLRSLSLAIGKGKNQNKRIDDVFEGIKSTLLSCLLNDPNVREDAFIPGLTPELYVDGIFSMLVLRLFENQEDCQDLLQLVKHQIY